MSQQIILTRDNQNVRGFLDHASLYGLAFALSRETPNDSFRLEWDCALAVTTTIIVADGIKLPPTLQAENFTDSPYGVISARLADLLSFDMISHNDLVVAQQKARRWAGEKTQYLKECVGIFTGLNNRDQDQDAISWLDANLKYEWTERLSRRGSIFDEQFAAPIGKILEIKSDALLKLHTKSSSLTYIRDVLKEEPTSEELQILKNAFVLSFLIRGAYYDNIARSMKQNILSHPLRNPSNNFSGLAKKSYFSNFEFYLSNIVLAASFIETDPTKRAAMWVDNVIKLRNERNRINFSSRQSNDIALRDAVDIARKMKIRTHTKKIESVFNAIISLGVGGPTAFYFDPFSGLAAGVFTNVLMDETDLVLKTAQSFSNRTSRLNDLALQGPGRVAIASNKQ